MCKNWFQNKSDPPVNMNVQFHINPLLHPNQLCSFFLSKGRGGQAGFSGLPGPIVSMSEMKCHLF